MIEHLGGLTVVRPTGPLDEAGLDSLELLWRKVPADGRVLVDLTRATSADETTWAFFAEAARRIRRGNGAFGLCNAAGSVRNSIFVSGLIARLNFFESEAEAAAALAPRPAGPTEPAASPPAETPGSELDRLARVLAFLTDQISWHQAAGIREVLPPLESELREKSALYEKLLQKRGLQRTSHEPVALQAKPAEKDTSAFAATGRRLAPRYRVNLTATLEWPGRTELSVVRNISEGGAGIGTNRAMSAGARAAIRIMNLPGSPPVKLLSEVRWCKRVGQVGAFDFESGLQFVGEASPELLGLRKAVRSLAGRAPEVPWT